MSLTKSDLIKSLYNQCDLPKNRFTYLVESLIEIIKSTLTAEDVLINGFGEFCVKEKRKRRGWNPATGEDMMVALRRVVTFKCSGKLRDKING